MTPKELFAIIDKRWKWATKEQGNIVRLHKEKPLWLQHAAEWGSRGDMCISYIFPDTIDFDTDDWTKCIARRDEIDMDEVLSIYSRVYDSGETINKARLEALTAVVEYVRKQLKQE